MYIICMSTFRFVWGRGFAFAEHFSTHKMYIKEGFFHANEYHNPHIQTHDPHVDKGLKEGRERE